MHIQKCTKATQTTIINTSMGFYTYRHVTIFQLVFINNVNMRENGKFINRCQEYLFSLASSGLNEKKGKIICEEKCLGFSEEMW